MVVDASLLSVLIADSRARGLFPWLRQAAQTILSERTCCGMRPSRHSADLRALKQRILHLDPAAMKALKGFLGTERLVFHSAGPKGLVTVEK
jgi:hypothetical protein